MERMSATKQQRLYFRMTLTVFMVLGCGGMMGYITVADPTSQFMSVWVGILTGVLALWANEQSSRKRTGIVIDPATGNVDSGAPASVNPHPIIHYVDMSSGTPPPSPISSPVADPYRDGIRVPTD